MLRVRNEKEEKKIRKRMLEERWIVARRTALYIDENIDRWRKEEEDSEKMEKTLLEE